MKARFEGKRQKDGMASGEVYLITDLGEIKLDKVTAISFGINGCTESGEITMKVAFTDIKIDDNT